VCGGDSEGCGGNCIGGYVSVGFGSGGIGGGCDLSQI